MIIKYVLPGLLLLAAACSNQTSYKKAEDAQDAGREFIRASLNGDYDKAYFYLFTDSTNKFLLEKWKNEYATLSAEERQNYKSSEIIVLNVQPLNDSVTTYKYLNTYKKDTTTIKVLRIKGEWLVDLKEMIR